MRVISITLIFVQRAGTVIVNLNVKSITLLTIHRPAWRRHVSFMGNTHCYTGDSKCKIVIVYKQLSIKLRVQTKESVGKVRGLLEWCIIVLVTQYTKSCNGRHW